MINRLGAVQGIAKLDKDLKLDLPQVGVTLDRERAAQLGVTAADIAQTLSLMTGGVDIADFKEKNQRYHIRLQVDPSQRVNTDSLRHIYVKNKGGKLVRLDSLVKFQEGLGPAEIKRRNRQYASFIYGALEGLPLGAATDAVDAIGAEIRPATNRLHRPVREFRKTGGYVLFAFGMALIMTTWCSPASSIRCRNRWW